MKRLGRFVITEELLVDALNLPEGSRIHSIKTSGDPYENGYELLIEAEGLRRLQDGATIPFVNPVYKKEYAEKCNHVISITLTGWVESK